MSDTSYSDVTEPSDFLHGMKSSFPVVVASMPFGILFGALAIDQGFTPFEAVLMSATVFAGASQLVGLNLFGQHVAPWLIVLSIFAVNFRHVLYSAAVGRRVRHWPFAQKAIAFFFLVDPQYAESERRALKGASISFAWYMGMALPVYLFWVADAAVGAYFGKLIPDLNALGVGFLLPIYFLGLVMGFRKRPLFLPIVAASATCSIVAYETVGSPWHVTIGALAGIVIALAAPVRSRPEGER